MGQEKLGEEVLDPDRIYFGPEPDWFAACGVTYSIDNRVSSEDEGEMIVNEVVRRAKELAPGQMVELITTFLPAPGIDLMKAKGYRVWPKEGSSGVVRTFFTPA